MTSRQIHARVSKPELYTQQIETSDMLAYVFWHRKKPEVEMKDYENAISLYQESLGKSHLSGFEGSIVAKLGDAPWFNDKSPGGYEDWYFLEGSATMDKLNEFAVSDSRKKPHDDLAHLATDFKGGLYQFRIGSTNALFGKYAIWLSKPFGTTYDSFYERMKEYVRGDGRSLWRRQMTLGPTTEFGIISQDKLDLPREFNPTVVEREILWRSKVLAV